MCPDPGIERIEDIAEDLIDATAENAHMVSVKQLELFILEQIIAERNQKVPRPELFHEKEYPRLLEICVKPGNLIPIYLVPVLANQVMRKREDIEKKIARLRQNPKVIVYYRRRKIAEWFRDKINFIFPKHHLSLNSIS